MEIAARFYTTKSTKNWALIYFKYIPTNAFVSQFDDKNTQIQNLPVNPIYLNRKTNLKHKIYR